MLQWLGNGRRRFGLVLWQRGTSFAVLLLVSCLTIKKVRTVFLVVGRVSEFVDGIVECGEDLVGEFF